ncbi:MAG: hypothetical protein HYV02_07750 [Deltaproteobacteria bacterium]|nr:hypothetical protein [Deltaproteobacteria bacterium]
MIKHAWTTICEKTVTAQETNNISLDILEHLHIQAPTPPEESRGIILPVRIEIVSLWYRDQNTPGKNGEARIRLEIPDHETRTLILVIDLTQHLRMRTRARLNTLPIPKQINDYYFFVTELKQENTWLEVARVPLHVEAVFTSLQ